MYITESLLKSIIGQYQTPLYFMCLRIINRTDAAQDVVMMAFEKLWFMREHVPADKVKAFLYISAKNLSFDVLRHNEWIAGQIELAPESACNDAMGALDRRDLLNKSYQVAKAIGGKSLNVFRKTYIDGLHASEIGNVSTVTSTRSYFITKIRQALAC